MCDISKCSYWRAEYKYRTSPAENLILVVKIQDGDQNGARFHKTSSYILDICKVLSCNISNYS